MTRLVNTLFSRTSPYVVIDCLYRVMHEESRNLEEIKKSGYLPKCWKVVDVNFMMVIGDQT